MMMRTRVHRRVATKLVGRDAHPSPGGAQLVLDLSIFPLIGFSLLRRPTERRDDPSDFGGCAPPTTTRPERRGFWRCNCEWCAAGYHHRDLSRADPAAANARPIVENLLNGQ